MVTNSSWNFTSFSLLQLLNALSQIFVKLCGKVTFASTEQSEKAFRPIVATPSGSSTAVKEVQF